MEAAYHRHDMPDRVWELLEPSCLGVKALGEATPATTASSSTRFSGSCALALRGWICLRIADRGYDSDAIIESAVNANMEVVIPPKKNRKEQRKYDKYPYRLPHPVENAFPHLKQWRGIATRYAKNTSSFLAAVHVRCIALWGKIY
jgi:transposase